jgi:hypothetical protein
MICGVLPFRYVADKRMALTDMLSQPFSWLLVWVGQLDGRLAG